MGEKLEKFREFANEKLESMEQRNQQLEEQLQVNHETSKKEQTQLQERIGELEAELFNENREDSLGELEEECQKLHEVIDGLRAENGELETRIGAASNNEQLQQQLEQAQQDLAELEWSSKSPSLTALTITKPPWPSSNRSSKPPWPKLPP